MNNAKQLGLAHAAYYQDTDTFLYPQDLSGYGWEKTDDWGAYILPYVGNNFSVMDCKALKDHPSWAKPSPGKHVNVWAINGLIGGINPNAIEKICQAVSPSYCNVFIEKPFRSCEASKYIYPDQPETPILNPGDPCWFWIPHQGKLYNCAFLDGHAASVLKLELLNNRDKYFKPN
jgi:prepilin-type processing-associated H-X9-DG protein